MRNQILVIGSALDRILLALCGFALLARLLLQPSLTHLESLGQEHIATLANSLILFSLTFLFILKKTILGENIRFPAALWPFALFCLMASLSISYSIDAPSSTLYMFDLWASFFFTLVLINLLTTTKRIEIIVGILIVLMAIASANAAYEYLVVLPQVIAQSPHGIPGADRGVQEVLDSHRPRTLFGWPNILSGFLVMVIPMTAVFFARARLGAVKFILGIAGLLALYALFVTLTVSSWIGLLAGSIVFLFPKAKKRGGLVIFLIVIVIAFTIFRKTTLPGANSASSRQQYFSSACSLIKLHPFLGSGWRSYGVANTAYIKDINGRSYFAHNSYLQIWAELGIFGFAFFFGILWCVWKYALVLFDERHRKNRWLAVAIFAGICGCMVDNLFSYTMIKPQSALFWWALCAMLIALIENLGPPDSALKAQMAWKKIFFF